jgi:aminoglycoside phosphotransferase (APT) family kinase protein
MGRLQRTLHAVAAPSEVRAAASDSLHPFDAGREVRNLPHGEALIHLDWHPLNLLYDAELDEITGIIDWDNARRGHPLLDLARTQSMLTVEPALATFPEAVRAGLDKFVAAWADGYGPEARTIPSACLRWAGLVMLADLAPRYAADPARLGPLRRWTDSWI